MFCIPLHQSVGNCVPYYLIAVKSIVLTRKRSATIIAGIRLHYMVGFGRSNPIDVTNQTNTATWTSIEISTRVICG